MNGSDRAFVRRVFFIICLAAVSFVMSCAPLTQKAWRQEDLPQPGSITMDNSVSRPRAREAIRAAQLFYAFWDTGKSEYAQAAIGTDFFDNALPEGCRQGPEGLVAASRFFRTAVPDLRCSVENLLVTGDKVVARLRLRGTHKATFLGQPATGNSIDFSAIDILRVENGLVVEAGHVEDLYNSTLMRQLDEICPTGQRREAP
jgi:predicted ester cyclase